MGSREGGECQAEWNTWKGLQVRRPWAFGELNMVFLAGAVKNWPWMSRRMKWEPELGIGTLASPWTPRDRWTGGAGLGPGSTGVKGSVSPRPLLACCADLPSRRPLTGMGPGRHTPSAQQSAAHGVLLCTPCFKGCSPRAGAGVVSSLLLALRSLCL